MDTPAPSTFRRLLPTLLPASVIVAAGLSVLYRSIEAREVAGEAFWLLWTFFTSPFVLETSLAIGGFIIVLVINQRRLDKDGYDWVEMEVPTPPNETEKKPSAE